MSIDTDTKVLPFPRKRRKFRSNSTASTNLVVPGSKSNIGPDIGLRRKEIIENERRSVKRTILNSFIGVHVVVPGSGLQKCSLYDISLEDKDFKKTKMDKSSSKNKKKDKLKTNEVPRTKMGVSFDLPKKHGHFQCNEKVDIRIYLNHKTYFKFEVIIRSYQFKKEEAVYRHGGSVKQDSANKKALEHFIRFIQSVNTYLKTDHGDVIVSNLDRPG